MIAPVGQACWQGAATQCLQTSLIISQRPASGTPSRASSVRAVAVAAPFEDCGEGADGRVVRLRQGLELLLTTRVGLDVVSRAILDPPPRPSPARGEGVIRIPSLSAEERLIPVPSPLAGEG